MTHNQLSENDQAMIGLLRGKPSMTVCELVEEMGVTATAVRQRLSKLMALGLVDRTHAAEGRGRPSHHYELTEDGRKSLANNFADLAVVLWQEVQNIDDVATRQRVISGAVNRLSEKYRSEIRGETTEDRMASITQLFAERQIPISFEHKAGLPVITVSGCPYPTLAKDNREICDMETELLSKVIGHPIDRCQCQQDGDQCCSFQAEQPQNDLEKLNAK
jgi:predicted ArsR family transcriptional regulator